MGKLVNLGILELPRRNVIIKEQVNLAKCAVLGLGKAEPAPTVAEKVCASVEEPGFGSPIPGERGNHPWCDGIAENSSEVVHKSPDNYRLVPQTFLTASPQRWDNKQVLQ